VDVQPNDVDPELAFGILHPEDELLLKSCGNHPKVPDGWDVVQVECAVAVALMDAGRFRM